MWLLREWKRNPKWNKYILFQYSLFRGFFHIFYFLIYFHFIYPVEQPAMNLHFVCRDRRLPQFHIFLVNFKILLACLLLAVSRFYQHLLQEACFLIFFGHPILYNYYYYIFVFMFIVFSLHEIYIYAQMKSHDRKYLQEFTVVVLVLNNNDN